MTWQTHSHSAADDRGNRAGAGAAREYLTFRLGAEEYAIDILRVQEIRGYEPPTRIADAPARVKGVVNLRGEIVPIVDLRLHLGVEPRFDSTTVTIVLNVGRRTIGAVVDSVSDVTRLADEDIRPAPDFAGGADAPQITGLGSLKQGDLERMLILLDVEQLMAGVGEATALAH
jgi:purine-binding chemotaxis protein CheW